MSEFSDRPLVAGSLTGVRSFGVDSLGRLRGVSFPEVWRPGVNEATCLAEQSRGLITAAAINYVFGTADLDPTKPPAKKPPHDVASMKCGCGFYAYHDNGHNPHHRSGSNVLGLVRGEGVATVGTRGFRCSRAEIVALVDPFADSKARTLWDRWSAFWDRHDTASIPFGVLGLIATALAIGATIAVSPWIAFAIPFGLVGGSVIPASFHGIDLRYPALHGKPSEGLRERFDLVRRNYPDVPVYASLDAAIHDFPLSTQPEPTPETADDFWTRSAS